MLSLVSLIIFCSLGCRAIRTATNAKFPYGVSSFKKIIEENRFYSDKTSYIRKLEMCGEFVSIWRPRRFGKTLMCDMLGEYYDAANSKEKLAALFGQTDIVTKNMTSEDMGKYLVLNFCFSSVSPDGDVETSFRDHVNNACRKFSEKYCKAGLLNEPVEINPRNAHSTLKRLFAVVERSGREIYLIVDECDSFANRLLLNVDMTKPDLGWKQYVEMVAGKESMLRSWGNVIKRGTTRAIARGFFTGVAPQALADGLSGLNKVKDISFHPWFAGLFGLTHEDVQRGLLQIDSLDPQQRAEHAQRMKDLYHGYRFAKDVKSETMYNPQYVLYYLQHLDQTGVPPASVLDPAVDGSVNNVAKFLVDSHRADAAYTLQNFAMGIINLKEESGTFARDAFPMFRSQALFNKSTVSDCLVSLACFHGFLTYKSDANGRSVLTSPNQITKMVFAEALFTAMPYYVKEQLLAQISSDKPDLTAIKNILVEVRDSPVKEHGTAIERGLGVGTVAAATRLLWQLFRV